MCIPCVQNESSGKVICRHCHVASVSRPRGLCWSCYYTPGVRGLYPSTSPSGYRSSVGFGPLSTVTPTPTDAEPGSEEKILVLIDRAARKQPLHVAGDARVDTRRFTWTVPTVRVRGQGQSTEVVTADERGILNIPAE